VEEREIARLVRPQAQSRRRDREWECRHATTIARPAWPVAPLSGSWDRP